MTVSVEQRPRISVLIAAHNAAETILRAVDSVLGQTFRDLELVVVDDGSRDGTREAVASVRDPRVRIVTLSRQVGRGAARNAGIEAARGGLVAILDADDVALPIRLQETVELFDRHPDLAVVGGQARFVSRHGRWRLRRYPLRDEEIRRGLTLGEMTLCHPACTIRRESLDAIGGYRSDLPRAQDFDLMRRLLSTGRFANSGSDFVDYHHRVLLPFDYWAETRRGARRAVGVERTVRGGGAADVARYAVAMGRRAVIFAKTCERV
jgi:glycosyltransferase involved in cell wall biosynthesis